MINPYMALTDNSLQGLDLQTQERNLLSTTVADLLAALHLHLETVNTQLDLRS